MCFHMISRGKPMTNYKNMKKLLQFFDFKCSPKMHWFNTIGWGMAISMHELVINKTKGLVQATRFISLLCDEITTCNQQSWVFIHTYMVENWHINLLLLSLHCVVDAATPNNLTKKMVDAMVLFGDLIRKIMATKFITFETNGVSVFSRC